jgi:formylglycine-generating enzyme required for sulfatase activity
LQGGFPQGWIPVPGNPQFGTHNFYVMKYDAVCSDNQGNPLTSPADGDGYNNGGNSINSNNCTPSNGRQIASLPGGFPIVDITHTQAVTYCASIGAHLITNDEYMTIVTNAVNQGSNWTGGSVGNGGVYIGNANNASEYPADANDANGYAGESNKTINFANDERRTYNLSNGSVIWDMSGNVWEHVQRSVNNIGDNTSGSYTTPSCPPTTGWNWCEYGTVVVSGIYPIGSNFGSIPQFSVAPPNGSWNSSNNMGRVYTDAGGSGGGVFIRGGIWSDGTSAGPFALNLAWYPSPAGSTVGFRCVR